MPQLPEVETTRRGIARHLEGRKSTRLIVREQSSGWPIPEDLAIQIEDARLQPDFAAGPNTLFEWISVVAKPDRHLGMSGNRATGAHW